MRKKVWFGIIAVVLIMFVSGAFLSCDRNSQTQRGNVNSNPQVAAQNYQREALISQQQNEINDLKRRVQECENRAASSNVSGVVTGLGNDGLASGSTGTNSGSLSMSGPIEMQVSGDMKVSGKLILTPTGQTVKTNTKQQKTGVTQTQKPTTQTVVVETQKPTTQTVVVQALKSVTQSVKMLPSYYYGSPGEDRVTYCLMYGGNENRHLPGLSPKSFDADIIKPNHLPGGGSNFYTYPTKGFVGSLGVTDQGIFFFSEELIEDHMIPNDNGLVQIKAPATGWVPLDLMYDGSGYYTWSPQ